MRTEDEKKLETLYEELDRHYANEAEYEKKRWEAYKEAMLNLEDELAELDFQNHAARAEDPIDFIKRLTEIVIEYNKS